MRTMTKCVMAASWLFVGSYGCRQVIGWEEATYWGDGGAAGSEGSSSSSSTSGGGMAGAAGNGGMAGSGGTAGAGGMGGGDAGTSECVTAADCMALPNATRTCTDGVCGFTCNTNFGDCTPAAGCETSLTNNRNHCGMCGNTCAAYCTGTTCNDPVSIAGGYHHHCAVMKNGDVYCWGRNEKGELGDGTLASKSVPTKVKLTSPAVQVDGGASPMMNTYSARTCAVMANGELWCWGGGNGTPAKIIGLSNIKQVSVGNTHTCAVTMAGTAYCWGGNVAGQVGDGGTSYVPVPTQIATSISMVCAGGQHSCAIKMGGAVYCWGDNASGQLGIGTKFDEYVPTAVSGIANVSDIRCGENFTGAISSGDLYCWGGNQFGQLGTGNFSEQAAPKLVNVQGVVQLDLGFNFSAAATASTLYMWGYNGTGQLGNGTTTMTYNPQPAALMNAQLLGLASTSSCALLKTNEIKCWGGNTYGQVGNGGSQQQLVPVPVMWP